MDANQQTITEIDLTVLFGGVVVVAPTAEDDEENAPAPLCSAWRRHPLTAEQQRAGAERVFIEAQAWAKSNSLEMWW